MLAGAGVLGLLVSSGCSLLDPDRSGEGRALGATGELYSAAGTLGKAPGLGLVGLGFKLLGYAADHEKKQQEQAAQQRAAQQQAPQQWAAQQPAQRYVPPAQHESVQPTLVFRTNEDDGEDQRGEDWKTTRPRNTVNEEQGEVRLRRIVE
jgi:hypothetical protein